MAGQKALFTTVLLRLEYHPSIVPRVLLLPPAATPASEEDAYIQKFLRLADTALKSDPPPSAKQD